MTAKLSAEYRVRWRRAGWAPNEAAFVVVIGDEESARRAADHIGAMYDDVTETVIEVRQVTRWRHHDIIRLDETPSHRWTCDELGESLHLQLQRQENEP